MAKWIFINGNWVEEEAGLLHFKDLSILRGYGIFDFFRLVGNEPLFLNDHLDRFFASAEAMHLKAGMERAELQQAIKNLIRKNQLPDTGIRIGLTGGYSADGFNLGKPNLFISQHNFTTPQQKEIEKGIKLTSYPYQRQLSHIKSIDYLMAVWLQPMRIEKNADDILYHSNGLISECPRANFFLITQDDRIVTPASGVLRGITRKKLIELTGDQFLIEEREVKMEELQIVFKSTEKCRELLTLFQKAYAC
ncbi:MAG: amino acid aminotransferase [Chitinophagaceae bacterium]|nr:MAG: amino acid aminotransferase [Chitinophagaceae bacterium]